jgi:hypothetical protein
MEQADWLYSGLMFAAGMLSLWTALLLTAAFLALAPALRKSAPAAVTISSTTGRSSEQRSEQRSEKRSEQRSAQHPSHHAAQEPSSPRSLSEALPQRSLLGRALRLIQ